MKCRGNRASTSDYSEIGSYPSDLTIARPILGRVAQICPKFAPNDTRGTITRVRRKIAREIVQRRFWSADEKTKSTENVATRAGKRIVRDIADVIKTDKLPLNETGP